MLFNAPTLAGLVEGRVTRTYRRWTTLRTKPGARYTTKAGVVEVRRVRVVDPDALTDRDARAAGFPDREALRRWTERNGAGDLYRVDIVLAGPDPRIALRARADLSDTERADLDRRLDRMDAAADAPWTRRVLRQIQTHPAVVSTELAAAAGEERAYFKLRVRRLKALGLTESLEVGYRLSPRGEAYLNPPPSGQSPTATVAD